jgi:serine/threonine-protein kinase
LDPRPAPIHDAGPEPAANSPAERIQPKPPSDLVRVRLTESEIQRVVGREQAPIMRCFERYKEDLGGTEGQVTVKFTIHSSGRVTAAQVTSGAVGDRVNRCLETQISALHFPPHKDKEVTLSLPFAYRVRR